jgi:RimJ/RimL family protein N-acetyltransferase
MELRLVYGQDDAVAEFVSRKLRDPVSAPYVGIGIIKCSRIVGGIILNNYNGANIEVTLYAPKCFRRRFVREIYKYVFEQAKCLRLTARTRRSNKTVCRLMRRLGFDYEATLKNYFGPTKQDDAIVFRLTHEYASTWM